MNPSPAPESGIAPVLKSIVIARDALTCFRYFAERASAWWPLATHSLSPEHKTRAVSVTFEPRAGGRVYETAEDGRQFDWGKVIAWEPGRRLAFTWHLSRPPEQSTRVEITFTALAPGRTRVELEHRDWEKWGADGLDRRGKYDQGWESVFVSGFAQYCQRKDD